MRNQPIRIPRPLKVLGLGVAGWLFAAWYFSPTVIEYDRYRQIQVGMTLKEVESVLGYPPGVYVGPEGVRPRNRLFDDTPGEPVEWVADRFSPVTRQHSVTETHFGMVIRVWFDENGRVARKRTVEYEYSSA